MIIDNVDLEILFTSAVLIGSSNTGFIKIVNQLQRINLVINNPPHTAHISHSRLKEWRLVLWGIRVISLLTIFILSFIKYCVLWTCQVVFGKYSLYEKWIQNALCLKLSPERPQINFNIFQPHPHPPPDHQTCNIEAQCHWQQWDQGPGPGGGSE